MYRMQVLDEPGARSMRGYAGTRWAPTTTVQIDAFKEVFCSACQASLDEVHPFGCPIFMSHGGAHGFWRIGKDGQPECRGFILQDGLEQ